MAAGFVSKTGASVFSVTTGEKVLVNVIAASTRTPVIVEMGISFDGVTASAVPVSVFMGSSTQATAGTVGSSPTPEKIRGVGTVLCTAGIEYTANPTALTTKKHWLVTPNGGLLVVQSPLGREMNVDLSGGTNKAIYISANPPATVGTRAYLEFEEE